MVLTVTVIPPTSAGSTTASKERLDLAATKTPQMTYGYALDHQEINMIKVTCNMHYMDALDVRVTPELIDALKTEFHVENSSQTVAELLEIGKLLQLWEGDIGVHASEQTIAGVTEICKASDGRAKVAKIAPDARLDLVIYHSYNRTAQEHFALDSLQKQLPHLLRSQKKGAKMIVQLPLVVTNTTVHVIGHLTSMYHTALMIRPGITPGIDHTQYLYLEDYQAPATVPKAFAKLGISDELRLAIQIHNYQVLPHLLDTYRRVHDYLKEGFFTGAVALEMRTEQDRFNQDWLSALRSDPESVLKLAKSRYLRVKDSLDDSWRQQLHRQLQMES